MGIIINILYIKKLTVLILTYSQLNITCGGLAEDAKAGPNRH